MSPTLLAQSTHYNVLILPVSDLIIKPTTTYYIQTLIKLYLLQSKILFKINNNTACDYSGSQIASVDVPQDISRKKAQAQLYFEARLRRFQFSTFQA